MKPAQINFQMQGRFKLEAVKRDGSRRMLADWFDNLILNAGLERMGSGVTIAGAMVGTNNATPAATQTALGAQIAYSTAIQGSATFGVDEAENFAWRRVRYRFAEGVATGNLAEVGVGWASGSCFSRALILDGGGAPTTITLLSDESLDVTYELRLYPSTADVTGSLTLGGTSYSYTLRLSKFNDTDVATFFTFVSATGVQQSGSSPSAAGWPTSTGLGDIYSAPGTSGTIANVGTAVAQTYTASSYTRVIRYTWGLANGSASLIIFELRTNMLAYKVLFSPAIPKTSANILTLDLQLTWARRP